MDHRHSDLPEGWRFVALLGVIVAIFAVPTLVSEGLHAWFGWETGNLMLVAIVAGLAWLVWPRRRA